MEMDVKRLSYFLVIAERGSISAAARELHVAQPALTRQMQTLEYEIGAELFLRDVRGITLTEAGKQLLTDARRILDETARIKERVRRAGLGEIGHLALALPVMQNVSSIVAPVLRRYRSDFPGVEITLQHLISDAQILRLEEGRLDAGFMVFRPADNPGLDAIPIYTEEMLLAYPSDWKWVTDGTFSSLQDLHGIDFVWIPRSSAPAWHDKLIHCFFEAGFVPRPSVFGVDAASMLTLVAAGMGCTVVPESARRHALETVSFVKIPDLDITQKWELVWKAGNKSPTLRGFVDMVSTLSGVAQ